MWRKGLIKKRKELPVIGNERRSDKLDEYVTLGSPGYGQGPLGLADIRSATRLPPQPLGPTGVPLGDMGVMLLIF